MTEHAFQHGVVFFKTANGDGNIPPSAAGLPDQLQARSRGKFTFFFRC